MMNLLPRDKSSQQGAILPFLIVAVLVVGILVGTKLVSIPQFLKSRASTTEVKFVGDNVRPVGDKYVTNSPYVDVELRSPYGLEGGSNPTPNAQPVFEDNFDNCDGSKERLAQGPDAATNSHIGGTSNPTSMRGCFNNKYEVTFFEGIGKIGYGSGAGGFRDGTNTSYKDAVTVSDFTAIFDARLSGQGVGPRVLGIVFGGNRLTQCNTGSYPCYRVGLLTDRASNLIDQHGPQGTGQEGNGWTIVAQGDPSILMPENKDVKLRFDRNKDSFKGWMNDGSGWKQFINYQGDLSRAKGRSFGFEVGKAPGVTDYNYTVVADFDNLKIYRYGDVPEPSTSGYYRYAADPESINNDPEGNNVKWQPYSQHPLKFSLPYPLRSGTNVLYAQFKSASGEKSRVFQASIDLGDSTTSPTTTPPAGVMGAPDLTSNGICVNSQNQMEVRGNNFGTGGTIYYSRGGSHEVTSTQVRSWAQGLIKLGLGIDDSVSKNTIQPGQYLRVCRDAPSYGCSNYVVIPSYYAGSCTPGGGGGPGGG